MDPLLFALMTWAWLAVQEWNWSVIGTVTTGVATVVLAIFSGLLWRVNHRLHQLQETSDERSHALQAISEARNDAVLYVKGIRLVSNDSTGEAGLRFHIWNNGLQPTQIRRAYFVYDNESGNESHIDLHFYHIEFGKARITEGHPSFPSVKEAIPFVGEFLKPGEVREIEAFGAESRGLRSYLNPRIRFEPVMGTPINYRIIDGVHWPLATNWRQQAQE